MPGKGNSVCKCLEVLEGSGVILGAMWSCWRIWAAYERHFSKTTLAAGCRVGGW